MRCIWVKEVGLVAEQYPDSDVPWYLTLCGQEGRDIALLIEKGLISQTEVHSIAEEDQGRIVAVENNNQAILKLQKRFAGLRIREVNFQDLTRGPGIFRWPDGDDEQFCRAHVVNLDLNQPLLGRMESNGPTFPVLSCVHKLCRLHERPPQLDWTLCLTLHGELVWPDEVNEWTRRFLAGNLRRDDCFRERCRSFLGECLFTRISTEETLVFKDLDRTSQQKVAMILVPKYLANSVHNLGWQVATERNLRYGAPCHAPMVSWILKFRWSSQATAEPDAAYRQALNNILAGIGVVSDSGEIHGTPY